MHRISRPFAPRKPSLRRKKNEDQNDYTQKIPLPGVSRVVPEEDLLQCGSQASHVFKLASKQPLDSWLAGRLILTHTTAGLRVQIRQYDRRASARSVYTSPPLRDCE